LANFRAVFDVGNSIAKFLQSRYPAELSGNFPCTFRLVSSAEIASEEQTALDKTVSVFLHRITTNEHWRNVTRLADAPDRQPSLTLDLHYLFTYWGSSAEAEQTILTWTMQQLQSTPILDTSILTAAAQWDASETIQLVSADLSLEDILRIWDALGPKYRLSVSYIARIVRVDRVVAAAGPVVATRFTMQQPGGTP
jgi:hypothetical protein